MAHSTSNQYPEDNEIRLWTEDDWWIAKDLETSVTTQGKTRAKALENLDEAVALYRGESGDSIESWPEEREVLEELDINPDESKAAREENSELPEFMQ